MTHPNPSTAMARAILDELALGGAQLVVVSPGSRSGALAIAASQHERLETRVILDERSAAFYALGRSKATGRPSVVVCTSGTAVANLLPAVVEASMALTPLIILSADRPAELRGVGSNQTIDQVGLFGGFTRSNFDLEAPSAEIDGNDLWRTTACSALDAALGREGQAGPVHINLAFNEPTVPVTDDGRTAGSTYPFPTERSRDGRWSSTEQVVEVPASVELARSGRILAIAGAGRYDRDELVGLTSSMNLPLLATAESGLRGSGAIAAYEWLLADGVPAQLQPDVTFVAGSIGPSRRLEALAASATLGQVRIDAEGRYLDPSLNATAVLKGDPVEALRSLAGPAEPAWSTVWERAASRVAAATSAELARAPLSGPVVANALNRLSWDLAVVGSSLPIRDVDATLDRAGRLVANRGASGIDGVVSTALGASSSAGRCVALIGDLALLHDSNALLTSELHDLVLIVVNNGGGGLFDLLPQAKHAPGFEELFIARQDRKIAGLASFHGIEHVGVGGFETLLSEVESRLDAGGVHLVEVEVDRAVDLAVRRDLDRVARKSLLFE